VRVYEAFCGIGGFSLGFQRAGFEIIGGCEIDPYARAVWEKRFEIEPDGDIRTIEHVSADIICGGFPCQPFSVAGLQGGTQDKRDLWPELNRVIRASQPRWIVLENVPALLSIERGSVFGRLLRDLAESGYDAEWDCLPASAFGAPHQRDRVFIVANSNSERRREKPISKRRSSYQAKPWNDGEKEPLADALGVGSESGWASRRPKEYARTSLPSDRRSAWEVEPCMGRVVDGIPNRAHRLRTLGNAVVPQVAEWIAKRIKEIEGY
jgi:DNA (cytosine-5)-methyltransferase 1